MLSWCLVSVFLGKLCVYECSFGTSRRKLAVLPLLFSVMRRTGSCSLGFSVFLLPLYLDLLFPWCQFPLLLGRDVVLTSLFSVGSVLGRAVAGQTWKLRTGLLSLHSPCLGFCAHHPPSCPHPWKKSHPCSFWATLRTLVLEAFREHLLAFCGSALSGQSPRGFWPCAPHRQAILSFCGPWWSALIPRILLSLRELCPLIMLLYFYVAVWADPRSTLPHLPLFFPGFPSLNLFAEFITVGYFFFFRDKILLNSFSVPFMGSFSWLFCL